jgi:phosphoribosyl 1,2-cyclic phosphate phosphodiesterase
MKITFLGCGTSTGVPVIGCNCSVCQSKNPKNKRYRASILISSQNNNILVDTSTDLRHQALNHAINKVNAVLFTHPHADHLHGIDELRSFNHLQRESIPCYGNRETIERVKQIFNYIFVDYNGDGWKPHLATHIISEPFQLFDLTVEPIEVDHGEMKVLGFKIGAMSYITDCNNIPEVEKNKLKDLDLLILDALRDKPHPTHFNVSEALGIVEELKPKRTIFTHLSHNLEYEETNAILPSGVELAYDGMEITL